MVPEKNKVTSSKIDVDNYNTDNIGVLLLPKAITV